MCTRQKFKFDGSLEKLKQRIVVRGNLQNKEMFGDTWYPTASMRTLKKLQMWPNIKQEFVNQTSFECGCKPKNRTVSLSNWILDIQISFRNMQSTLEEP